MYTIQKITNIIQPNSVNLPFPQNEIEDLLFDSRQILDSKITLFFAIKGVRNDGHQFIPELIEKGVQNFVISDDIFMKSYPDINFLVVKDTVSALQEIGKYHRDQFDIPVIGISGSNGKTIVKDWLFQLLQDDFKVIRSPKSYNSQIGVPISVWKMGKEHDLAIFEAGITTKGVMKNIAPIINCKIGIFTNIGTAHDEGFDSLLQKTQEKAILFENAEAIIYNKDYNPIQRVLKTFSGKKLFSWSKKQNADLEIKKISISKDWTEIDAIYQGESIQLTTTYTDDASIENMIHLWATMFVLGYKHETIVDKMNRLTPVAMRLELIGGFNNCKIINDSYSLDLTSLHLALNFLDQQANHLEKVVIISDIFQTGIDDEILFLQISKLIEKHKIHSFIGIGKQVLEIKKLLPYSIQSHFFENTKDFIDSKLGLNLKDSAILIKGARAFQFEEITTQLTRKLHKTVLEINMKALEKNYLAFSELLKKSTKIMAMVKASAYGSGSVEIAKFLEYKKVDYMGVAYADEGIELRNAGITTPILVLNPEQAAFKDFIQFDLEPEIYNFHLLEAYIRYCKNEGEKAIFHLKLDSGMHRMGFEPYEIPKLVSILKKHENTIQVKSMFSHLASSEAKKEDDFTQSQFDTYLKMCDDLEIALPNKSLRHILNTAGIIRFPQYQLDMVRLGTGLYGIDSNISIMKKLIPCVTLKSYISQIKTRKVGDTVGYSRNGLITRPSKIAAVALGYADGLPRKAGNGNYQLLIKNQLVPTIGNISMDMCMIDITGIENVHIGDEVVVFGKYPPIQTLAIALETITYEILTGVPQRVKRIYVHD